MSGLTEFLLARIAETEAAATEWRQRIVLREPDNPDAIATWLHSVADHLLARCEADRHIVDEHWDLPDAKDTSYCATCVADLGSPRHAAYPCPTLRALASVYADHPEFREEWA